jgi:hypothetical protein
MSCPSRIRFGYIKKSSVTSKRLDGRVRFPSEGVLDAPGD